jgi:hypothetical protein
MYIAGMYPRKSSIPNWNGSKISEALKHQTAAWTVTPTEVEQAGQVLVRHLAKTQTNKQSVISITEV